MSFKIWLGPAGNCLTAKKPGWKASLERVAELGLNCQEIEFVRGVKMGKESAEELGRMAKDLGVSLSVHAPYYINLCSQKKSVIEASKRMIIESAERGEAMGAEAIAIHAAYYSGLKPEEAFEVLKKNFQDILDKVRSMGIENVRLGLETMGRASQFGSVEEIVKFCMEVKGAHPYIDWAHCFVRGRGTIDYGKILDALEPLKMKKINSHFEGVKKNKKGEYVDVHAPIGSPPFEPLAKELLKRKVDITIISESPLLEKDSLVMKGIFERLGYKF